MKHLATILMLCIILVGIFVSIAPCFMTMEEQAEWYQLVIVDHGHIFSTVLFVLSGIIFSVLLITESRRKK